MMNFKDETFDIVIDKGTLDALLVILKYQNYFTNFYKKNFRIKL